MTAPVLERDVDVEVEVPPTCQVEDTEASELCGEPAVVSAIVSCPAGHEESLFLCKDCRQWFLEGEIDCTDCEPRSESFIVAEVAL